MSERFPTTPRSWIDEQLATGPEGQRRLTEYLIPLYSAPLTAFVAAQGFIYVGDARELTETFLADRMLNSDYILKWRKKGRRLHKWLQVGLKKYVLQVSRNDSQARGKPLLSGVEVDGPDVVLQRKFIESAIRMALELGRTACRQAGLDMHWQVFERHYLDHEPYPKIQLTLGIRPEQAAVMAKAAKARFVSGLREVFIRDGMPEGEFSAEISSILETERLW